MQRFLLVTKAGASILPLMLLAASLNCGSGAGSGGDKPAPVLASTHVFGDPVDAGCSNPCDGTGPGGVPVSANCGDTACGEDNNTYICTGSGFVYDYEGCSGPDAGCECDGTGPGGTPVQTSCGNTACGEDNNTYLCTSSGFTYQSEGCGSCDCMGTGPGGTPVTVTTCGGTACGEDNNTYQCTSSGFVYDYAGCCDCEGTGPGGTPVTVTTCGGTACGEDNNTYSCTSSGFVYQSAGCSDAGADAGCTCDGTGPGGTPVSASCGDTACGEDDNTYLCTSTGFMYQSAGCP